MFNCNLLSRYRLPLMGVSAILILLCHAPASVTLPSWLETILVRGGMGVDMFLLLSGLGLYYSLNKLGSFSLKDLSGWYIKRFKRLLIPYLLICVPSCLIKGIMGHVSLMNIIGDISTINFWLHHSGPWFIALIIPLYLFSPFLYLLLQRNRSNVSKFICALCIICVCFIFSIIRFRGTEQYGLMYNIQFAISRVPAFVMGMYLGKYALVNYKFRYNNIGCILLIILAIGLKYLIPNMCISGILALPVLCLLIVIFSLNIPYLNQVSSFMGKISLESYLFNVILPFYFINHIDAYMIFPNDIAYCIVIVLGTVLSFIIHRFSTKIELFIGSK